MRKIDHFLSTSPRRLRWLMSLLHLRRVAPPNTPLGSRKNAKGFFTVRAMAGAHAKGCDKLTKAPSTSQTVEARGETFEVFFLFCLSGGLPPSRKEIEPLLLLQFTKRLCLPCLIRHEQNSAGLGAGSVKGGG